uniref:Uncharacterized protein n=1 Tax=Phakopsora pachyrhizi TaxID=170000 RepID=A0A0S1MIN6_PHAPC
MPHLELFHLQDHLHFQQSLHRCLQSLPRDQETKLVKLSCFLHLKTNPSGEYRHYNHKSLKLFRIDVGNFCAKARICRPNERAFASDHALIRSHRSVSSSCQYLKLMAFL